MEKKLVMTFIDAKENNYNLTVNSVKEGVTVIEINAIMDNIISTGVFQSKDGALISKESAVIVDTTTTEYPLA